MSETADTARPNQTGAGTSAKAPVRDFNLRSAFALAFSDMRDLIRAADLELLGQKAEQNTSNPSNPRAAIAADYTAMFTAELAH